ncbi:hypothetical protein WG947_07725 [Pontibacter sp. H259]|uniref:hypothetical protein n=1 Tax=Pontibacter sp. H259 TaxID=3133421 RepID=UPI0030BC2014
MRNVSVFGLSAFDLLRCRETSRGTREARKQQRDARNSLSRSISGGPHGRERTKV